MSISTILGFIFGFGLFLGSILFATNEPMVFLNIPSVLMVIGGTFASTFISYEPLHVINAFRVAISIVFSHKEGQVILTNEVGRIIRWGYIVQKTGLQGLESDARSIRKKDRFVSFGIDLVITGYSGDEVREILTTTVDTSYERSHRDSDIMKTMGGASPAFGMIGTLVGLIIMLQNVGEDASSVGPGMALALITTLYGVLSARMVFLPAATKIIQREEVAMFRNVLLTEGLALLAERKSPRYIQDRMNSYLDPSSHYDIDRDMRRG